MTQRIEDSAMPSLRLACETHLAPYAMHAADSAGRVHAEPEHAYRSPYQRDRDRIIHASAFRRLAHKTQVFIGDMGDYHRSRLTHTLEVASIARTIARALQLNEDLVEALALLHDVGHPPFGHAGEDALDECLAAHGGFNHNRQALRIAELLEQRYAEFPGLNLTREVLSGQGTRAEKSFDANSPVAAAPFPLLEVQAVDAADSIAYDAHDADDAVELGLLELEELDAAALWQHAADNIRRRYAALGQQQFRRSTVHEVIDLLVSDLLRVSSQRIAARELHSTHDARRADCRLIAPSDAIAAQKAELEQLLFHRVYRHGDVLEQRSFAAAALHEMFARLMNRPQELSPKFAAVAAAEGLPRAAADYLSGMTDRFALEEHSRLIVPQKTSTGGR